MNVDKELTVLEKAIDIADKKKNRQMATNVRVINMLAIVRRFVERKGRLLYGGMAINFILPEEDRFYNPDYDVPDYDFMTPSGARDAIELADEFHKLGYPNVEVKPALHVGTLKVQVDFVAVADVTTVSRRFYNYLVNDSVNVDGLRFVGPNYLRMAMYLELSRPMGDVSRWGKVFKRLRLLDDAHPQNIPECGAKTHNLDNRKTPNMELQEAIAQFGKERNIVFMGDMALNILRNISKRGNPLRIPDRGTQYIFLSEDARSDANLLIGRLNGMGINPRMVEHAAYGELVPVHQELRITMNAGRIFSIFVYQAQFGCHSQQKLKQGDGEELQVASVQTILSFQLAFVMSGRKQHDKKKLMCISRELIDLADTLFKSGRPPFLGFPVLCMGHQPQREDMMRERNEVSAELKAAGNDAEYLKVFLSYNPARPGDAKKKNIIKRGTAASPLKSQRQASVRKSLKKNSALKYIPSKATANTSRKTSKRLRASRRRSNPFK